MWRGGAGGDGLQGLLPGRVLQRFAEQIFDKDGLTLLNSVEAPQLQFIVVGLGVQRIGVVQFLDRVSADGGRRDVFLFKCGTATNVRFDGLRGSLHTGVQCS